MTQNNNHKSFKIIITLLSLLLLISLFYIYKMSDHSRDIIIALRGERATLEYELTKTKRTLDSAIVEKGHLNNELIAERDKIDLLLNKIKNVKLSKNDLSSIKISSKSQELRIGYLMHEIEKYKRQIDSTQTQLVASNQELNLTKKAKDTLESKNNKLIIKLKQSGDKLTKASKLTFYSLEGIAYKKTKEGEIVYVDKASKAQTIKTSFIIAENELAPTQIKKLFIQILTPDGQIISSNETTTTGDKIADYTSSLSIKFEGQMQKIEREIPVQKLKPGIYQIKLFDEQRLILENTLLLK